jgi:hypothetical protein
MNKNIFLNTIPFSIIKVSGVYNFDWVSIVHTILPSVILPLTVPGHKKIKKIKK